MNTYQGKLGFRLRELRTERRLSVRTLAARTGFSPSFISQVESDLVSPSISSLEKIAGQLGVTLGQLFTSIEAAPRTVVRKIERATYNSAWSRSTVEVLTDVATGRRLSGVQVAVEPGGTSGKKPAPSLQDAVAYVLSGTLKLTTETEASMLEAGDSVYLREGDLFMWQNDSSEYAVLLLVSIAGRLDVVASLVADPSDDLPDSDE